MVESTHGSFNANDAIVRTSARENESSFPDVLKDTYGPQGGKPGTTDQAPPASDPNEPPKIGPDAPPDASGPRDGNDNPEQRNNERHRDKPPSDANPPKEQPKTDVQLEMDLLARQTIDGSNREELRAIYEGLRDRDQALNRVLGLPDFSATDMHLLAMNEQLNRCGLELHISNDPAALQNANRQLARQGDATRQATGVLALRSILSGRQLGESIILSALKPSIPA